VPLEGKAFVSLQVGDVFGVAGDEVIQPNHFMSFRQETVAEVRAEKSSGASD
jgi:hypothetical protein